MARFDWQVDSHGRYLHVRVVGPWPTDSEMREARRLLAMEGVWRPGVAVLLDLRGICPDAPLPSTDALADVRVNGTMTPVRQGGSRS